MEKLVVITNTELIEMITTCLRNALQEQIGLRPGGAEVSDILSHKEAALFLHMSEQTLYGYCHRLAIPYFKGGGNPSRKKSPNLFSRKELFLWLQNGRQLTKKQIEDLLSINNFKKRT